MISSNLLKIYKTKPYKWPGKVFRWCFCGSYNNALLGFLRNLSVFFRELIFGFSLVFKFFIIPSQPDKSNQPKRTFTCWLLSTTIFLLANYLIAFHFPEKRMSIVKTLLITQMLHWDIEKIYSDNTMRQQTSSKSILTYSPLFEPVQYILSLCTMVMLAICCFK